MKLPDVVVRHVVDPLLHQRRCHVAQHVARARQGSINRSAVDLRQVDVAENRKKSVAMGVQCVCARALVCVCARARVCVFEGLCVHMGVTKR